jgi:hypothetical protein
MKQITYVRINNEKHPAADEADIVNSKANIPTNEDFKIVDEIISYNKMLGIKDVGGEWSYLNEFKRKEYIDSLKANDRESLAKLFCNFFQNSCGYGIITPAFSEITKLDLASQIKWDIDAASEFCERPFESDLLHSPQYGSPFGLINNNKLILPDSPRHLYFAQKLLNFQGNILEIGGGYGGLAYFLKKIGFKETYFNVDLPETLYIAYYYLRKNNFKCTILTERESVCDMDTIYLIPHFLFHDMANNIKFNVFFNANSLSEMDISYVNKYLEIINTKKPEYILHSNSNFLVFPNSERHIEILARDFPICKSIYDKIYHHISPFQGASGRYREFLYKLKL